MQAAMLKVFGRTGALDEYQFGGKTDWQVLTDLLGMSADEVAACLPTYSPVAADSMAQIIDQYNIEACPDAFALIDALNTEPRALLGILTGNLRSTAPMKLRAAGFDPAVFKVAAYGSEAPHRSLLPTLAAERARALHGIKYEGKRVVIIGDTPDDVTCGHNIGARTIALLTGRGSRDALEAHKPDYLFEDLRDTSAILAAILAPP